MEKPLNRLNRFPSHCLQEGFVDVDSEAMMGDGSGAAQEAANLRAVQMFHWYWSIMHRCFSCFFFTWSKQISSYHWKAAGPSEGLGWEQGIHTYYIRVLANSCSAALWTKLNVKIVDVPCFLARVGKVFPTNYAVPLCLMNIAKHIVCKPFLFNGWFGFASCALGLRSPRERKSSSE